MEFFPIVRETGGLKDTVSLIINILEKAMDLVLQIIMLMRVLLFVKYAIKASTGQRRME